MAYAYVQGATGADVTSGTSITTSLTGVTAGNFLVAVVRVLSQTRTITGITGGGTWVHPAGAAGRLEGASNAYELWYLMDSTGGDFTVEATASASLTGGRMFVAEYSGIKTTSAFDLGTGSILSGATSPATVGPISVTGTPSLIICAGANLTDSRTLIAPTDTTNRLNVVSGIATSGGMLLADKRKVGTGDESATWTWTGGTLTGQLFIVAFTEEATGPTIDTQPTAQTVILTNGDTATFTVAATTSGGTLVYDWELEDGVASGVYANLADGDGATWTGQTAASAVGTFTATTLTGRRVRCNVTDDNGTTTTDAVALGVYDGPSASQFAATNGSGQATTTVTNDYVTDGVAGKFVRARFTRKGVTIYGSATTTAPA